MSAQPTAIPTPADIAPATPATPAPEPAAAAPDATPAAKAEPNVWENPETAKAEIERLRKENGKDRTTAKETAANEARQELANTIGKALGLVADEPADPAKLTEQAAQSAADAKQARVELAVFRNAATAGADPQALLDSASFLAKVRDIDPSDAAAVAAAITEAVTSNPRLGAAGAPPVVVPQPNPAQGTSGSGPAGVTQRDKAWIQQMGREGKHHEIEKARAAGELDNVLSGKP